MSLICCFGCISICGCRDCVVRPLTFYPPRPSGYGVIAPNEGAPLKCKKRRWKKSNDPYGPTRLVIMLRDERQRLSIRVPDVLSYYCDDKLSCEHILFPGDINGFHFKHSSPVENPDRWTIIFSHGNSTDIGYSWISHCYLARRLKVDLISYDYPGYGLNGGKPSESNTYSTIRRVYDFAVTSLGIPASNIILYGQSIGSGPAVDLYTKVPVGGLILHSAIASGLRVYKSYDRPRRTPWFDLYRNVEKLSDYFAEASPRRRTARVPPPVFIIHGTDDEEVPCEHGMQLAEAVTGDEARLGCPEALFPPWWVKGATHNDIEIRYRDQYYRRVKAFVRYLMMDPRPDGRTITIQDSSLLELRTFDGGPGMRQLSSFVMQLSHESTNHGDMSDCSDASIVDSDDVSFTCTPGELKLRESIGGKLPALLSEDSPVFDPSRPVGDRIPISLCKGLTFVPTPVAGEAEGRSATGLPPLPGESPPEISPASTPSSGMTPLQVARMKPSPFDHMAPEFIPFHARKFDGFWHMQQRHNAVFHLKRYPGREADPNWVDPKLEYDEKKARRPQPAELVAFPEVGQGKLYGLSPLPEPFALPEVMTIRPSYFHLRLPPPPPSPPATFTGHRKPWDTPPSMSSFTPPKPAAYSGHATSGYTMPPGINPFAHQQQNHHHPIQYSPMMPTPGLTYGQNSGHRPPWETGIDRMMSNDQAAAAAARRAMSEYHRSYRPPMDHHGGHHHHHNNNRSQYSPYIRHGMTVAGQGLPPPVASPPMPTQWRPVPPSRPLNSNAPPFVQAAGSQFQLSPSLPPSSFDRAPPGYAQLPPAAPPLPFGPPHQPLQPPPLQPPPLQPPQQQQTAERRNSIKPAAKEAEEELIGGVGVLWEDGEITPPKTPGQFIYLDKTGKRRVDEIVAYTEGLPHNSPGAAPFIGPLRVHPSVSRMPGAASPAAFTTDGVVSLGRLPRIPSPVWQSVKLLSPITACTQLDEELMEPLESLVPPEMKDKQKERLEAYAAYMKTRLWLRNVQMYKDEQQQHHQQQHQQQYGGGGCPN
ncbi:hypothetical protein FOL47_001347 [Perkinsus chesapeaki]|uniref:Peptidase S9 prolyl oligopeptidase catalytic domain-containing protein n=1 Tax=Perkinsus chesapeaki TaxID=330153 RepID=A0A7J6MJ99_PERCH|nr:hypothetical protein FOL47_001347 [Perkinsus chesapeaki]